MTEATNQSEKALRSLIKSYVVESEQPLALNFLDSLVRQNDALVQALEAMEWAVPTPEADNDGSCPSCYAGKPVKFWVVPTVFERKNHMKVCQLATALEQVK